MQLRSIKQPAFSGGLRFDNEIYCSYIMVTVGLNKHLTKMSQENLVVITK